MTTEETASKTRREEAGAHHVRGKWTNSLSFLFTIMALLVGPMNIWSFPYLLYRNGGVAFLYPYCVMLLYCGFPLFFLEIALGQYTSEGGVTAWRKICPMFEGIGVAAQVLVSYFIIGFFVIIAWIMMFLIYSFKSPLPWSTCDNWWNSVECKAHGDLSVTNHSDWSFLNNVTSLDDFEFNSYYNATDLSPWRENTPEGEFWKRRVLRSSADFSLGVLHWDLALCVLAAWVLCYFCIFKGIKVTEKVVYFTSTFPYVALIFIFFRAVTLPGAAEGLFHYFYPNLAMLASVDTWYDALHHVMYSIVPCQGVLIVFGSYNKYNNDCYRDSYILIGVTVATNIVFTVVVASVTGFLAGVREVPIGEITAAGISIFTTFTAALVNLPGAHFWTVLFFLMMFFLVIDAHILCMESLATTITDMFPHRLRGRREMLVLVMVVVCFLLGLPFITEGGMLLFTMFDYFCMSTNSFLFVICLETVVIGWVYGADRFLDNIEDMIGYRPYPVIKYCWLFVTPLLCWLSLDINLAMGHKFWFENYHLSRVGTFFGCVLIIAPLMCIPVYILITLCRNFNKMATPSGDLRQVRPHKPLLSLCKRVVCSSPTTVEETNDKMMMEEPSGV